MIFAFQKVIEYSSGVLYLNPRWQNGRILPQQTFPSSAQFSYLSCISWGTLFYCKSYIYMHLHIIYTYKVNILYKCVYTHIHLHIHTLASIVYDYKLVFTFLLHINHLKSGISSIVSPLWLCSLTANPSFCHK